MSCAIFAPSIDGMNATDIAMADEEDFDPVFDGLHDEDLCTHPWTACPTCEVRMYRKASES